VDTVRSNSRDRGLGSYKGGIWVWITTCVIGKKGLFCGFSTGIRRNTALIKAKPLVESTACG
jgi:hypothetical protein